jgi:hypothetical protein
MSQDPDPQTSTNVRRVVLPSGKTIEVMYFAPGADHGVPAGTTPDEAALDLQHCGTCGSDLVYPVEWTEAGATHWEVVLRCPNCEWVGTGIYDQDTVDRFDDSLDRGTAHVVRDLRRLQQANMEDEIERFVAALDAGHVLPEDF